jgi:hypothetical protein
MPSRTIAITASSPMPVPASPAPRNSRFRPLRRRRPHRRPQRRKRHGGGALDVVVEAGGAVLELLQDTERVAVAEVLELHNRPGEHRRGGHHELVDDLVVGVAAQARLLQSDVERVAAQRLVVGADVERDRQAPVGMHARARGVERQLADRDAHAVGAEIAETEDPLAVGDDDHPDGRRGPVAQHRNHPAAILRADEQPARPPPQMRVALARLPDRRRVDDRHRLGEVIGDEPVEQAFVAILQRDQIDVLLEIRRLAAEAAQRLFELLIEAEHARRQQAAQVQAVALLVRKRGALVQCRIVKERDA